MVTRRASLAGGAAALVVLAGMAAAPGAQAASASAVARWSMVPQSKDADRDGIIDGDGGVPRSGALGPSPSATFVGEGNHIAQPQERLIGGALSWYLSPRGFPVRLDACGSTGDRYRWRIDGAQALPWRPVQPATCLRTLLLPEGPHRLLLEVTSGSSSDVTTVTANVRNILIVALGDSYASGEGNPRNVVSWVRSGQAGPFTPYWDDSLCHRSARGAPAQAALMLERSSPTTSVTLVDVTCSGATVNAGVLGPQSSARVATSQIEQARALIGTLPVDLVTLSVGGNDVGFTSVLQSCALNIDCPLTRASSAPLDAYPRLQDGVQALTGGLPAAYRRIAACLVGVPCTLADGRTAAGLAASGATVLPTLYPDITRAADGQSCAYFTIDQADFAWARQTILNPAPPNPYAYPLARGGTAALSVAQGSLNQQVAATSALPGWRPVTGTWTASADTAIGHGVCAGAQAWAFGATLLSSLPSASFHPNIAGQQVLAKALAQAMTSASRT